MPQTPRLRSAFPKTPSPSDGVQQASTKVRATTGSNTVRYGESTISPNVIAAPSQRLYVTILYMSLMVWRLYDYTTLKNTVDDGFPLFTKWIGIDTIFLYALSGLQIPWLRWSPAVFTVLFISHGLLNWFLMFQVSLPSISWLSILLKVFYDREISVSGRLVKPASLIQNDSLIRGRQIIHILPEGSVSLNPAHLPFCLGESSERVDMPFVINMTRPSHIDLMRIDLATKEEEMIRYTSKNIKNMMKAAKISENSDGELGASILNIPIERPGIYHLIEVLDEHNLKVPILQSVTVVAICPRALMRHGEQHRCQGDLSNFSIQVDAIQPARVRYSKIINQDDHGHSVLSLQPEHAGPARPSALMSNRNELDGSLQDAMDPAIFRSVQVPVNETLDMRGIWRYVVDQVQDSLGNVITHSEQSVARLDRTLRKPAIIQDFQVHGRPRANLNGCDLQNPLRIRAGSQGTLPIRVLRDAGEEPENDKLTITYLFTPQDELLPNLGHAVTAQTKTHIMTRSGVDIAIEDPGLYTLLSVTSSHCQGAILEPASCVVENPPRPSLKIRHESISDSCAGRSVGTAVDLDLSGTPPFLVHYAITYESGRTDPESVLVEGMHKRVELRPKAAGHYGYEFTGISDAVYIQRQTFAPRSLLLEQDVSPPASAHFADTQSSRQACLDMSIDFIVDVRGEPPLQLNYELLHRGLRSQHVLHAPEAGIYPLQIPSSSVGGQHTIALTSLSDRSGCKVALHGERNAHVSMQKPKASFGQIEGKHIVSLIQGNSVDLPIRLQGRPPWRIQYARELEGVKTYDAIDLAHMNDHVRVSEAGKYMLRDVADATCPGIIDERQRDFEVRYVSRPIVSLSDMRSRKVNSIYQKNDACEGDEDAIGLKFEGTPPFHYEYERRYTSESRSRSVTSKKESVALYQTHLMMDTTKSGKYEYHILKLGDGSYQTSQKRSDILQITQTVYSRPDATFTNMGQTYKYCQEKQDGTESIPIVLSGMPPFRLRYEIRYAGSPRSESHDITYIGEHSYDLQIVHKALSLGLHTISLLSITDSRGCEKHINSQSNYVHILVAELPTIVASEEQETFCIGDRISFELNGVPPFNVYYEFQRKQKKAVVSGTKFRRIAESPGEFSITALSDQRSTDTCRTHCRLTKTIHQMPSVKISKGETSIIDIHEGGQVAILFDFEGTPPFHFTYTRSSSPRKGHPPRILETKTDLSESFSKTITASEGGIYEIVSIRDRYCAFARHGFQDMSHQKLLQRL